MAMNYYPNYNQFYNQGIQQMPKIQPMEQQYQPQYTQTQQVYNSLGLQGKSVASIEIVKAMDIPLDGSTSYFPITDGSAIVTKQLQNDGTSKTIIYKPVQEEKKEAPKYVTIEELKKEISKIDLTEVDDLRDELAEIKKEIKSLKKKEN